MRQAPLGGTPGISTIAPEEVEAFLAAVELAYAGRLPPDELRTVGTLLDSERCLVVREGGAIVATAGSYRLRCTLPWGKAAEVAGISFVGVHPVHRRRGLLRLLLAHQLQALGAEGFPFALLTASEGGIYGRFGFGVTTWWATYRVRRDRVGEAPRETSSAWRLEHAWPEEVAEGLRAVYRAACTTVPGGATRPELEWHDYLADPPRQRDGSSALNALVAVDARAEMAGYALYRLHDVGQGPSSAHRVDVVDLQAPEPGAASLLWRHLARMDLADEVLAPLRSLDEPLRLLFPDPRAVETLAVRDGAWLRILDVRGALAARGYGVDGGAVLEVVDPLLPANRGCWSLEVRAGRGHCERVRDAQPAVRLGIDALGAAYLGGTDLGHLARAGLVEEVVPGGVARAAELLRAERTPWLTTTF